MPPARHREAVTLRAVTDADLDVLFAIQADPAWAPMVGLPSRSREDFVAHQRRVVADPGNVTRAIEVEGEVVGSIATFPIGDEREVGYSVARERWGRGIATEALRLMLEEDTTRPLSAVVALHNAGSRRVLEKLGFREVGVDESDGVAHYRLT